MRHHARPDVSHVGRGCGAGGYHGAGELELGDGRRREGQHGKGFEERLAAELQSHVRYADQDFGGRAGERGRGVGCRQLQRGAGRAAPLAEPGVHCRRN